MTTDETAAPRSEHCFTPSWCRCPDEPMCQLCRLGRCPVDPSPDASPGAEKR